MFGRTEYISEAQKKAIKDASANAQIVSKIISYLGAAFYFLNACQLLDVVVDVMQQSYYYTFFNLTQPINSELFFSTFNAVSLNFHLVSVETINSEDVVTIDESASGNRRTLSNSLKNQEAPSKFSDNNISSSFIVNAGSLLVTLFGFFIGRYLLVSIHDCYNEREEDH